MQQEKSVTGSWSWQKLAKPISHEERLERLARLRGLMEKAGYGALLLGSTSSLNYFTGLKWYASERLVGAVVTPKGLTYIAPAFEQSKIESMPIIPGDIRTWEEEESPYALVADCIGPSAKVALDELLPLFAYHGMARTLGAARLGDAGPLTTALRSRKAPSEIALMTAAKTLTLEVHRRAHGFLRAGVKASEVARFIDEQHRALGAAGGNTFCIVSFGADSALPHGGEGDPALKEGDVVLIDTGCRLDGYHSDITRTYVFGQASGEVKRMWSLEKEAQAAAFAAAKLGEPCEAVDAAARQVIVKAGLGPDYQLPGLPHRTGHGIGLDIHEAPNLVRGERMALDVGMCFSNEPMIVVPGRFGIRLEDHFHMTQNGPKWFTQPQASLEEPFKGVAPLAA